MKPEDYFTGEDLKRVREELNRVYMGEPGSAEANLANKDGSLSPYIFSVSSFRMNGETYFIGTGQDISPSRKPRSISSAIPWRKRKRCSRRSITA